MVQNAWNPGSFSAYKLSIPSFAGLVASFLGVPDASKKLQDEGQAVAQR